MATNSNINFELLPYRKGHDHQSFRLQGRHTGYGWIGIKEEDDENILVSLERCPDCGKENYYASAAWCRCTWCGFDAKPHLPNPLPAIPQESVP